jgi:hypothetical protein
MATRHGQDERQQSPHLLALLAAPRQTSVVGIRQRRTSSHQESRQCGVLVVHRRVERRPPPPLLRIDVNEPPRGRLRPPHYARPRRHPTVRGVHEKEQRPPLPLVQHPRVARGGRRRGVQGRRAAAVGQVRGGASRQQSRQRAHKPQTRRLNEGGRCDVSEPVPGLVHGEAGVGPRVHDVDERILDLPKCPICVGHDVGRRNQARARSGSGGGPNDGECQARQRRPPQEVITARSGAAVCASSCAPSCATAASDDGRRASPK